MQEVDLKVVLLGTARVGKTSLFDRLLYDKYVANRKATVGASYGTYDAKIGNKTVRIGIWDTAGSERFQSMGRIYYHRARGALVCFDVCDAASFEKVSYWVSELKAVQENVILVLVGNKTDLLEEGVPRGVPLEKVKAYAESVGAMYFETSAKQNVGVEAPFLEIAKVAFKSSPKLGLTYVPIARGITLNDENATRPPAEQGRWPCPC